MSFLEWPDLPVGGRAPVPLSSASDGVSDDPPAESEEVGPVTDSAPDGTVTPGVEYRAGTRLHHKVCGAWTGVL